MELTDHQKEILSRANRAEIVRLRGPKPALSPRLPAAAFVQREPSRRGECVEVATLILTGAECPFACSMCDLWKHTLDTPTVPGDLIEQIERGLSELFATPWVKLYNASNFFDPRAVPDQDRAAVGKQVSQFDRVIVENHPRLLSRDRVLSFRDKLAGKLEIAMGLETIHPFAMQVLNKQMSPSDYASSSQWLAQEGIDIRAFVLLQPPGVPTEEAIDSLVETVEFAWQTGVRHVSLIPTRRGNPWLDKLIEDGLYGLPNLASLEISVKICMERFADLVVVADTWDWSAIGGQCEDCSAIRRDRMERVNLGQCWLPLEKEMACRCTDAMS